RGRLQGARVHQRAAEGILLQGRRDRTLQPALLHHPARGGSVPLPALQSSGVGGAARPRRVQARQRRAGARRRGRHPSRDGGPPAQVLARHQRHLPLGRRRVRGAPGGNDQGRRPALRRAPPPGARRLPLRARATDHGQLRHRRAARGRRAHRGGDHPGRRRGPVLGQAIRQEPGVHVRGHHGHAAARARGGTGLSRSEQPAGVLIVDDDRHIRDILRELFLSSGYDARVAADGQEALEAFDAARPPLTVTDVHMPVMDGVELLKKARALDPDAAFLVLTGVANVQTAVESLKYGAFDFIMKPVHMDELLIAAERALQHRQLLIERREHQVTLERKVEEATRELASTLRELESTYRTTLEALGSAIDTRDLGTHAHSRRVRGYSLALARAHGFPEAGLRDLEHGVLLHDIGKIGIPDAILLKPGPLTPAEWKIMRTHPEIGRQLVEQVPFLRGAVPIVYHHHERWDGTGYPLGLKGEDIPLGARIFALADAFDAMTFDRPYSQAIPLAAARQEIQRSAGTHFDPLVVETFLRLPLEVFETIRRQSVE